MVEDADFSLHRRGVHRLAGRTILQVVASLDNADADRAAIDVAASLAEIGARPLVAAPLGHLVSELQAKGGIWLDFPTQTKNPLAMILNIRHMSKLLAREQIDLVHARSRPAGWVCYAATRSSKTPFVTSLHQIAPGQSIIRQRYNAVMAKGDLVIAGSKFAAATIASVYPVTEGQIVLVRPGVDLHPFDAATIDPARVQALRHAWRVAPDDRIILLVARPSVWKGHKVLIEAVRILHAGGFDDLKLVFIGKSKGGMGREIDQTIRAAGIGAAVRTVESCEDLPAALLAAAAVVVPSIEPESFGRVAVEAQAVGTPVLVCALGAGAEPVLAPPDTEPAKRSGWRVTPSDPALLADAISEALSLGASGRDALAQRARKQVEERFSNERMVQETLGAYTTLIERNAAL